MSPRSWVVIGLVALVGCSGTGTVQPSAVPTVPPTATSAPSPGFAWVRQDIGARPGPVVAGLLGRGLKVSTDRVTAAVYMFRHPAGNSASVWLFRADGVSSAGAIARWATFETRCALPPVTVELAGFRATEITFHAVDQCEPEYLVPLDDRTVAMIIDDGGYQGNAAQATPVPYRPVADIEQLVDSLRRALPTASLMPGGSTPPGQ